MEAVAIWVSGVAAVCSIVVAVSVALAWRTSARRMSAEISSLRARVEGLDTPHFVRPSASGGAEQQVAEFLITDAGTNSAAQPDEVSSRVVLSATVGEPLVKVAAFAYGVRRALTPENRNRIRFQMRREIRRSRKARRAAQRAAARAAAAEAREQVAS